MRYLTEMSESDLSQYIRDNCGEWFSESRGYMMRGHIAYRGLTHTPKDGDVLTPRSDRRPKDSNLQDQQKMDDELERKFGWRPRQEGMFCTGNSDVASMYGDTYAVFPLDGYKYIWSPKVPDFYSTLYSSKQSDFVHTWNELLSMFLKDGKDEEYIKSTAINNMVKTYKSNDLAKAIESGNEIIVKCKGYVVVSINTLQRLAL